MTNPAQREKKKEPPAGETQKRKGGKDEGDELKRRGEEGEKGKEK